MELKRVDGGGGELRRDHGRNGVTAEGGDGSGWLGGETGGSDAAQEVNQAARPPGERRVFTVGRSLRPASRAKAETWERERREESKQAD